MDIPGEDLPGSWPATAFVAWYNGHPDFQDLPFDLSAERAVVVGNGNVAVDVARMLALTAEEIEPTDTTDEAIAAILGSGIREILVLGRRGPAQAAFTTPELQELTELAGADLVIDPADLELDPASEAALEDDTAIARRNVDLMREVAGQAADRASRRRSSSASASRRSRSSATARSRRSRWCRNELVPDASGSIRAVPTEEREVIPCGLVLRSVGYRGHGDAGNPLRRGARHDQERRRARSRRCRRADPGRLLHRAGSSAGRAASSGRTRRTRPRPSSSCSRTCGPGSERGWARHHTGRVDELLAEREHRRRLLRGLGGDRRRRVRGGRATRAVRASSCTAGTRCSHAARRRS